MYCILILIFFLLFPFPFYPSPIPFRTEISIRTLFCSRLFARQRPGGREGTGERETPPGSEVVDGAAAASPGQPTEATPTRRRVARTCRRAARSRRRAGSKLVDDAAAASTSCPPRPPPLAHAVTSPAAPTRPRSLVSRLRRRRRASPSVGWTTCQISSKGTYSCCCRSSRGNLTVPI